jgi:hypothetical protein
MRTDLSGFLDNDFLSAGSLLGSDFSNDHLSKLSMTKKLLVYNVMEFPIDVGLSVDLFTLCLNYKTKKELEFNLTPLIFKSG